MELKARAKVNLALGVRGRRQDGYHELLGVMQTLELCDDVVVELAEMHPGVRINCNFPGVPGGTANLAYLAASKILAAAGLSVGVNIHINKRIPVAAGLAGGSADAAAVIRGLSGLVAPFIEYEKLLEIARGIGADVPFCLDGGTMLAEGVGDVLMPLAQPPRDIAVALVTPPIAVSSADVFTGYSQLARRPEQPDIAALRKGLELGDLRKMAEGMGNSLEAVTAAKYPIIMEIKRIFMNCGAAVSLMSGSGPSVFALFEEKPAAQCATKLLEQKLPGLSSFITSFS